jgi:hypothetical protein
LNAGDEELEGHEDGDCSDSESDSELSRASDADDDEASDGEQSTSSFDGDNADDETEAGAKTFCELPYGCVLY